MKHLFTSTDETYQALRHGYDHTLPLKNKCLKSLEHNVQYLLNNMPNSWEDPDHVYRMALTSFIDELLDFGGLDEHKSKLHDLATSELLTPAQVGEIYEFLMGFRIEVNKTGQLRLVPNLMGKRNQGLFYTPPKIVRLIVTRTLDALEITEPSEYLDLKILDPAAGAGNFLTEALEQITSRILLAISKDSGAHSPLLRKIESLAQGYLVGTKENDSLGHYDMQAIIRRYVAENCLYGIDIDETAVKITRAAIKKAALNGLTGKLCIGNNLRRGNTLVGKGNPHWSMPNCGSDQTRISLNLGNDSFDWPAEFPEIFWGRGGFDVIIGNPPYEILSIKESGISRRREEQEYLRRAFSTCQGKLNTYRLMLERSLELLKEGGTLGFIVPATLLADSSAEKIRRLLLDNSTITDLIVLPERAQVFKKVTQALLILILQRKGKTQRLRSVFWDGNGANPPSEGIEISRSAIKGIGLRIPLIRSHEDKQFLEALEKIPPLGGDENVPPIARVHQGEMNLTIQKRFITTENTGLPLVRGEHVLPMRIAHPSRIPGRLDWVTQAFLEQSSVCRSKTRTVTRLRNRVWEKPRIVIGRVVNMETARRLKAAYVPAGTFLGDMTNFILEPTVSSGFLLGLLNSRLLNYRIKLTSTNNYISAAEIESLPVPRVSWKDNLASRIRALETHLEDLVARSKLTLRQNITEILAIWPGASPQAQDIGLLIELVTNRLQAHYVENASWDRPNWLWNLLDALVLLFYRVEFFAEVLDREKSDRT